MAVAFVLGFAVGGACWPGYERTSVSILAGDSEAELKTRLEQGWELDRVEYTTVGGGARIPTYFLHRRRLF